jgi:hypothetical protein
MSRRAHRRAPAGALPDHRRAVSPQRASAARVIAQGECNGDENAGSLFVKIFRNGTLVWSGGNGAGVVTAIYQCRGSATGDFRAPARPTAR